MIFFLFLLKPGGGSNVYPRYMSRVVRKPAFCICENKDADQLRGNREADQRLCFRYTDSTIPLLFKSEISSLYPSSVAAHPGLCGTWSETPKTGFLRTRLICFRAKIRKNVFPYKPQFYYIKVGCKGSLITKHFIQKLMSRQYISV